MGWTPPPQPTPFNTPPEDVLFVDVETVPKVWRFADLDEEGKKLFIKKVQRLVEGLAHMATPDALQKLWEENAALYCEFNKIACVSMGVFTPHKETGERTLRVKSFFGYNEAIILQELAPKLGVAKYLCAHNGKRFDFQLMARKYIQHGLPIPSILNVTGTKPWEVSHFDTLEVWQFNDLKNFTSLDTLAYIFGIPSPKAVMDGSKVAEVYYGPSKLKADDMPWEDETLRPVATYCEGDVVTDANVYLRLINKPMVKPENIIIV
jgi:hypothetical protein